MTGTLGCISAEPLDYLQTNSKSASPSFRCFTPKERLKNGCNAYSRISKLRNQPYPPLPLSRYFPSCPLLPSPFSLPFPNHSTSQQLVNGTRQRPPSSSHSNNTKNTYLVYAAAALLRLFLFGAFPGAGALLEGRVEVGSCVCGFKAREYDPFFVWVWSGWGCGRRGWGRGDGHEGGCGKILRGKAGRDRGLEELGEVQRQLMGFRDGPVRDSGAWKGKGPEELRQRKGSCSC